MVDIKSFGIGESSDYVSFRAEQGQLKPIDCRAVKGTARCKAAKDLDSKCRHTPDDKIGPDKSALFSFGPVAGKYEGHGSRVRHWLFQRAVCLLDSMAFVRSSRAIARCPTWVAKTTSQGPGHFPLKDPPRVGSCGQFRLERPHLGSQPQACWLAIARRLRHACGWRLRS